MRLTSTEAASPQAPVIQREAVLKSEAKNPHRLSLPMSVAPFCQRIGCALILLIALTTLTAHGAENPAVKAVAPYVLTIGESEARFYLSADWTKPQRDITTALLIFHGKQRNAEDYFNTGLATTPAPLKRSTLVIAPQFLEQVDIDQHRLPAKTLRWDPTAWSGGEDSIAPAAVSSYTVIDQALLRLSDRKLFPNLKTVIIAGHSAGGQVVSRYVAIGKGPWVLEQAGYKVHIVVANPSSWLYFSPERPDGKGGFITPRKTCNGGYDKWKYGIHDLPPYGNATAAADIEKRFMALDVTVLLGTADNDPNHPALDKSCAAELQGRYRLERGESYFSYLQKRHPDIHFRLMEVDGIGHDGDGMFQSPCGQFALFGTGACNHIVH